VNAILEEDGNVPRPGNGVEPRAEGQGESKGRRCPKEHVIRVGGSVGNKIVGNMYMEGGSTLDPKSEANATLFLQAVFFVSRREQKVSSVVICVKREFFTLLQSSDE
jgi:hypothetical protein